MRSWKMDFQFVKEFKKCDFVVAILGASKQLPTELADFAVDLGGVAAFVSADENFKKKFGETKIFHLVSAGSIKNLLLFSTGDKENLTQNEQAEIGGKIFDILKSEKCTEAFFLSNLGPIEMAEIANGLLLKSFFFNKYFTSEEKKKKLSLANLKFKVSDPDLALAHFQEVKSVTEAVFTARELVSEAPNVLHPESYAEICQKLEKFGLEVEVLNKQKITELGMNALLGVAVGSAKEPRVVVLKWFGHPNGKNEQPISFIGKGVTFDTGGISLKPSAKMDEMKYDMAGSAAVVGVLQALASRKAKVNAIGVIGLVENMPDGAAQRPGDVVKSMSGQTIEVLNTDAEGRLVLADILHYCKEKFAPKLMVDLATLTGAIVISLGTEHAGLFSNSDELSAQLIDAGLETDEKLWRLPLSKAYDKQIDSQVADMQNISNGKGAGSITAAQFLQRFVGEVKWAHLDIAGVAWAEKSQNLCQKGATAFGVRLLNQFVKKNHEK